MVLAMGPTINLVRSINQSIPPHPEIVLIVIKGLCHDYVNNVVIVSAICD